MKCEKGKPGGIPYYYTNHNIKPNPNNDWVCVNGEWIWTVKGIEKAQVDKYEKKVEAQPFTKPARDAYGTITYHGKQYVVWVCIINLVLIGGLHTIKEHMEKLKQNKQYLEKAWKR